MTERTPLPAAASHLPAWGPYHALRPLGEGTTGQVWLARDTVLDRLVALKVLAPSLGRALDADSYARREGRLLSRLSHPHVVAIHQFGATGDERWLVMEYVEGGDLAARIASGARPGPAEALRIVRRIGEALAHAHAHGIVHRDVKPQNVLLASVGADPWWVKVADFGLARVVRGMGTASLGPGEAGMVGTPLYMAPEQVAGQEVDARADVYALALLAWELLAGHHPFEGGGALEVMLRQTREPVPPLSAAWREGSALDAALARALAKAPAERTADVQALVAELDAASRNAPWGEATHRETRAAEAPAPRPGLRSAHHPAIVLSARVEVRAADGAALYRGEETEAAEHLLRGIGRCVERGGGRVTACLGDEVVAVFPHEDGPTVERALDAALSISQAMTAAEDDPTLDAAVRVRGAIGLDAGAVLQPAWLGDVPVLQGDAVAQARAVRGPIDVPAVSVTQRIARHVEGTHQLARHGEVTHVLGRRPTDTRDEALPALPFVGRGHELGVLEAAARDSEELSTAHVVLVLGDAGMGKSRLVAEAVARLGEAAGTPLRSSAAAPGAAPLRPGRPIVLSGRCPTAGTSAPFSPFAQALGPSLVALADSDEPTGEREARLALRLLGLESSPDPQEAPRPGEREAAFAAVAAVLRRMALRGPVLLHLDDMGAATDATLDLLHHIIAALAHTPVTVVLAARTDAALGKRLSVPLERLRVVRLSGLRAADVEHLAGAVLAAPSPSLVRAVVEATFGLPLHVEELLDHLRRGAAPEAALPRALDAVVLRRCDALGPDESELLLRHAVCGDVAWRALLSTPGSRDDAWRRLRAAGFVLDTDDDSVPREPAVRFRHGLVQEIVYRNLPPRWRRDEHRRIGAWLEEHGARPALVAFHARRGGDSPRAAEAALRAGLEAQRAHASKEALAWFEEAVRSAEQCPTDPGAPAVVRSALLEGALACAFTPHPDEAFSWLDRAERHPIAASKEGRLHYAVRSAIRRAEIGELLGRFDDALTALEAAQTLLAGHPDDHLLLVAASRRAMVLARRGRLAEAEPVAREALALVGEEPPEPDARREWHRAAGALHAALGHVACRTGRLDEGLAAYEASRRHWDATGWPAAAATARLNLGLAAWWAKDLSTARVRWEAAAAGFSKATALHGLATALTNLGELELEDGHPERAVDRLLEAERVLRSLGTRDVLPETLRLRAEASRRAGHLDEAERTATEAAAMAADIGSPTFRGAAERTLADILRERGRPDEARRALVRAREAYAAAGQAHLEAAVAKELETG